MDEPVTKAAIMEWIEEQNRPVLFSELRDQFGEGVDRPFALLTKGEGPLMAVFPEASPGNSGRQFWDFRWLKAKAPNPDPPGTMKG